jgi:hypothetical protein
MAKYYLSCGTLQLIWSTNKTPQEAVKVYIHEVTEDDELDEFIYVDERGFRDYQTAEPDTFVCKTEDVLRGEGYIR